MAAPAYVKTWQHYATTLVTRTSMLLGAQGLWYNVKNALTTFGTLPWTVQSSCNGAGGAGSFGASDKWLASTNLIWAAAASNHSWIVLRQTGIAAKFEICIDCASTNSYQISFVFSPVNGFGTANGGADGTATARPTASDEIVVRSVYQYILNDATQPALVNVQQSTDGFCTRVVFCADNAARTFMIIDKMANAISWTGSPAVVGFVGGSGVTAMTYANWNDVAALNFKHNATAGTAFMGTMGYISAANGENALFQHDLTGEYSFDDIGVVSETAAVRGLHGTLSDIYFGVTAGPVNMSEEDSAGNPLGWVQFGHLILPWSSGLGLPRFA